MEKVIIVSGFAGSGKSTLAKSLAMEFGLRCIHASDLLRQLQSRQAKEIDTSRSSAGSGWWESEEAAKYLRKRMQDKSMDRALDEMLLKEIGKGNVVVDSWAMPWLSKKGFKIWLKAPAETRAGRVAERDRMDEKEVAKRIVERDKKTAAIYRKLYGFELGKDFTPFNLVIDTDGLDAKQVFENARSRIRKLPQFR